MFFNIGESKVKTGSGVVTPERDVSFPFRLYTFGYDIVGTEHTFFKSVEDAERDLGEFTSVDSELSGTGVEIDPLVASELLLNDSDYYGYNAKYYIGNFSNVWSGTSDNYLVIKHSDGRREYYQRQEIPVDIKGEGYSSSAYTTYSYNPYSNYYLIRYGYLENIEHYEYRLGGYNISTPDAILFAAIAYSGDMPAGVTMLGTMSEGTYDWRYLPRDGFGIGTMPRTLCEIDVYTGEVVKVIAGGETWSSQYYGDRDIVIEKGKCYCLFAYGEDHTDVKSCWEYGWQYALSDSGFETIFPK